MLLATPAFELMHEFSPDGRFFSFSSTEAGQVEVSVWELASDGIFPVSTNTRGGVGARWSHDGKEIYYAPSNGAGILVAEVTSMDPFSVSGPREISAVGKHREARFGINFDVTADGQRFLVRLPATDSDTGTTVPATPRIHVVLNWFEELKRRVPPGGR